MIGERFGNYRALSLLGEGGMGAVYLAEHPEIGRKVAVKVLRVELGRDPQLLQRFLNEARAANAIRHPGIIEILDAGSTMAGVPYLVMELLEGESLAARIDRLGRLSLGEALEIGYQTASALEAAHRKGIVHRDLKPDNLFLVADPADPSRERVKVLDFGIAKLQQTPFDGGPLKTRTGTLMGTPVYMSPEQCLGNREVDHRTDVYALGVILFEMLCGKPPFYSDGFGDLVNLHLNAPPPSPRAARADLPEAVDALLLRALAKRPADRFSSMAELQGALRAAAPTGTEVRGVSSPRLPATLPPRRAELAGAPTVGLATPGATGPERGGTTFSESAAERPRRDPRRSPLRPVILAGVAMAAVAASLLLMRPARPPAEGTGAGTSAPAPAAPAPAAATPGAGPRPLPAPAEAPGRVRWSIETVPPGAAVVDVDTGERWGETPLVVERAPVPSVRLRVEKAGFAPRLLQTDGDRHRTLELRLEGARTRARPARRRAAPPADEEPAKL